mgnify:CR=1 FL=1
MQVNAQNQRDWADQQMRERKQAQEAEAEDERLYAQQTEAITRMRGMLEDENAARQAAYRKQIQQENLRMAQEKRDRESAWRNDQEA